MKQIFQNNDSNADKILENSDKENLFQFSENEDDFIIPIDSYSPCSKDTLNKININTCSIPSYDSSNEYQNIFNNSCFNDLEDNIPSIYENIISKGNHEDAFLGKKRKINFEVKKSEKKRLFKTHIYQKKKNHITLNDLPMNKNKIIKRFNSNSSESTYSNNEKNEIAENALLKNEKFKLFITFNYEHANDFPSNEGRWTFDEHIKFIKAFVCFGKKYKFYKNYLSTRNNNQIRSHAQKFFMRLKSIKNDVYDFTKDNINSLSDIINIIGANNKTNIDKKRYIINTLISLSENNKYKFDINNPRKNKNITNEFLLENKNEIKMENGSNNTKNKQFNEVEYIIIDKEEINKDIEDTNNILIKSGNINEKEVNLELADINNIANKEQIKEIIDGKIDIINKGLNYYNNYSNIYNIVNESDKVDNDYSFSSDESGLLNLDGVSPSKKDYLFCMNRNLPVFNYISNYFS